MALQWYPGHMTKGRRELTSLMPSQDVVIEVLDARCPHACSNPLIAELRGDKPVIRVLTKSDLADPEATRAWLAHYGPRAFASTTNSPTETRKKIEWLAKDMAAHRGADKDVRALICGVPNVGKSTLINTLAGKAVAKVSDKPAVTKEQQKVTLAKGMVITDTPGMMWPKIEDEHGAFRLAIAGSIPDTAVDYLVLGMFAAAHFIAHYPQLLRARYKIEPTTPEALLFEVGKRRGGLQKGGAVDLHKAADLMIHEFRAGTLGRISLEMPRVSGSAAAHPA